MNIAIDGPAGAGKSTVARAAAAALGFIYIDTGALYRAVGVAAMRRGIATNDGVAVSAMLPEIKTELRFVDGEQRVLLNGEDVSKEIRFPEASMAASNVSAIPAVREYLFSLQQNMAASADCLMDGRDIGTVVLPNAELKIFLTASAAVRAKRRFEELRQKGTPVEYETLLREIEERDRQDSNRAIAPLKAADDAVLLDTSDMNIDEVVSAIVALAKEKM